MDFACWLLISQFLGLSAHVQPMNQAINQRLAHFHQENALPKFNDESLHSSFSLAAPNRSLQRGPSMLLIGTIDGGLAAFSADSLDVAQPLWELHTAPGSLLSSSLSKIELVRDGAKIQLIPSLDGTLFSFDGEKIEPLPVSADSLLSSSFKISEDSVITGGKETTIYGLDVQSGKVKYVCSTEGCNAFQQNVEDGNATADGTLVVRRLSQTVRAFDIHRGNENWNFSVGSLEITLASRNQARPSIYPDADCLLAELNEERYGGVNFRFDVATGTVHAMSAEGRDALWNFQFKSAITGAWMVQDECVRPLDLVTSVPPFFDHTATPENHRQLIYIGHFDQQLYIQRAATLPYPPLTQKFPHVTFRPLLINAPSRTPAIAAAYRPLLRPTANDIAWINTEGALVPVIGPHQYPFDNGYFLAEEEPAATSVRLDDGALPSSSGEDSMLTRVMRRWMDITGIFLLPLLIAGGVRLFRRNVQVLALEAPGDGGLKRQNTSSSSSTKSLTSVLSLQELGPKVSRFQSDFEVLEQLGKGGFGVVYAAKNRLDDNVYAVKKIQLPKSDAAREKVRREVRVLAKLDHVGIVRFYNAWVEATDVQSLTPSTSSTLLDRGDGVDGVEPTSMSDGATSTDLIGDWIGTRRRQRKASGVRRSSVSEPVWNDPASDASVEIVFEQDSKVREGDSVCVGLDQWTDDFSTADPLESEEDEDEEEDDSRSQPSEPAGKSFAPGTCHRSRSISSKMSTPSLAGMNDLDESSNSTATRNEANSSTTVDKELHSRPQLFIQMELCRKETLKDWLRLNHQARTRNHILDIFYQIVCAVDYIHSRGLMHRDLKPSNVLFSLDGTAVKIADFGLVTATDDEDARMAIIPDDVMSLNGHHTNQVGTSLYMSTELMAGRSYNEKIDCYSLGLIYLELLSPFNTEMERIVRISDAKRLRFTVYSRDAQGGIIGVDKAKPWTRAGDEELLQRLLAPVPDERPSAADLRGNTALFRDLMVVYDEGGLGSHGRTRGQSFSVPNVFHGR